MACNLAASSMDNSLEKENHITFFAETNFRNKQVRFGIKRDDRRAHTYIIGKTGTGKSTLLETLICQDIASGQGLALLDPHGDLVEKVLMHLPEYRKDDLIYFNVSDHALPLGMHPPPKTTLFTHTPLEHQLGYRAT